MKIIKTYIWRIPTYAKPLYDEYHNLIGFRINGLFYNILERYNDIIFLGVVHRYNIKELIYENY